MSIASRLQLIKEELPEHVQLVAVSKFHPVSVLSEAYRAGQRLFGESKVQEITVKYDQLPKDIEWHFIGHLQTNKIKYIAPFVHTIHSVDSLKLLQEIDKNAGFFGRKINVLFQIHIAQEETKFGFSYEECEQLFQSASLNSLPNLRFVGLMGMATFTENKEQVRMEYAGLASFFKRMKESYFSSCED